MDDLQGLLERSRSRHRKLCPRQVLGVRMGLAGAAAIGLGNPREDKRLLVILETDGCFADGVEVATGCTIGGRTLRVQDYGKVAGTFVDVDSGDAVRLTPRLDVRKRAALYAPHQTGRYDAQLEGYQWMPEEELFSRRDVLLTVSARELMGRPGVRVNCDLCGEEIINQREVRRQHKTLCRACVLPAYYTPTKLPPKTRADTAAGPTRSTGPRRTTPPAFG